MGGGTPTSDLRMASTEWNGISEELVLNSTSLRSGTSGEGQQRNFIGSQTRQGRGSVVGGKVDNAWARIPAPALQSRFRHAGGFRYGWAERVGGHPGSRQ